VLSVSEAIDSFEGFLPKEAVITPPSLNHVPIYTLDIEPNFDSGVKIVFLVQFVIVNDYKANIPKNTEYKAERQYIVSDWDDPGGPAVL
jgi:hypothetical protein